MILWFFSPLLFVFTLSFNKKKKKTGLNKWVGFRLGFYLSIFEDSKFHRLRWCGCSGDKNSLELFLKWKTCFAHLLIKKLDPIWQTFLYTYSSNLSNHAEASYCQIQKIYSIFYFFLGKAISRNIAGYFESNWLSFKNYVRFGNINICSAIRYAMQFNMLSNLIQHILHSVAQDYIWFMN